MNEWALVKIAGGTGGAIGALAVIVAKKQVSKIEAYSIVSVGVALSIFLPTIIAKYIIIKYGLVEDLDTLFGIVGVAGLLSGLLGYMVIGGIYKMAEMFHNNPIPFIQKLLSLFGKDK